MASICDGLNSLSQSIHVRGEKRLAIEVLLLAFKDASVIKKEGVWIHSGPARAFLLGKNMKDLEYWCEIAEISPHHIIRSSKQTEWYKDYIEKQKNSYYYHYKDGSTRGAAEDVALKKRFSKREKEEDNE